MSEYRIRSTGEVKTQGQIRSDHPNTSLPKVWTEATCDGLGIDPVLASPQPDASGDYKVVVRDGAKQDANDNWVYAWTEQDMFTEYEEEVTDDQGVMTTNVVTVQDQIDAYEAANTATLAATERATRDELLKDTDHYGLSDVTMSDAMTAYRQALRDVPQQEGFPQEVTWPEKPE
jgi:hypothetical protein